MRVCAKERYEKEKERICVREKDNKIERERERERESKRESKRARHKRHG